MKRPRASASLPVLSEAWAWDASRCAIAWHGVKLPSLLTVDTLRGALWELWMRALDALGVDHGMVGVVDLASVAMPPATRATLERSLARLDAIGDDEGDPSAHPRTASSLITVIAEHAARAHVPPGASIIGAAGTQAMQYIIRGEGARLQHRVALAHILGTDHP